MRGLRFIHLEEIILCLTILLYLHAMNIANQNLLLLLLFLCVYVTVVVSEF